MLENVSMTLKERYQRILENIDKACNRANRSKDEITIMAVCKGQTSESIKEAIDVGIKYFGENRTQEAAVHMSDLKDENVEWHYIGKLQKNKINKIIKTFDFIQSVDGIKSLEHIQKRVSDPLEVFIEINIADEKTKSGFTPQGLRKAMAYISNLTKIKVTGFMLIPPFNRDPENVRPYFMELKELQQEINSMNHENFNIQHLSMGMSNDYDVAVEEGATIIRIGTELFGRRI
jgi:pyridoxal phosphate enzyme (YggS family)